ncbi:MAG: cupin domain-containing protein [bacterium]|nr:cupin domain-containing protein [bacterium]
MDVQTFEKVEESNFSLVNVGDLSDLGAYTFSSPEIPGHYSGKLFLKNELHLSSMEVSINKLAPGQEMPYSHKHRSNEELYLFLKGKGQFRIDGKTYDVREGTAIRVAPDGIRTWRNTSTEDLSYIIIQAKAGSLKAEDITDGVNVEDPEKWPE